MTLNDVERTKRYKPNKQAGGGIPIGGTKKAGHASWYASIKPKVDATVTPAPPDPGHYVQNSIIMKAPMMSKSAKGSIIRSTPVESLRPTSSSVQKPGHHYVPHFQLSEVEAPRVYETPSLMQESYEDSDESMMDNEEPTQSDFQSQTFTPGYYNNETQTFVPNSDIETQTDLQQDLETQTDSLQQDLETQTDSLQQSNLQTQTMTPGYYHNHTQTFVPISDLETQTDLQQDLETQTDSLQQDLETQTDSLQQSNLQTQTMTPGYYHNHTQTFVPISDLETQTDSLQQDLEMSPDILSSYPMLPPNQIPPMLPSSSDTIMIPTTPEPILPLTQGSPIMDVDFKSSTTFPSNPPRPIIPFLKDAPRRKRPILSSIEIDQNPPQGPSLTNFDFKFGSKSGQQKVNEKIRKRYEEKYPRTKRRRTVNDDSFVNVERGESSQQADIDRQERDKKRDKKRIQEKITGLSKGLTLEQKIWEMESRLQKLDEYEERYKKSGKKIPTKLLIIVNDTKTKLEEYKKELDEKKKK